MITGRKLSVIADINSNVNNTTGDRSLFVVNGIIVVAMVDLVGINTALLGQQKGFNYAFTVTIDRIHFKGQKYILFDDKLYSVAGMSKAKYPNQMNLQIETLDDSDILETLRGYRDANIS